MKITPITAAYMPLVDAAPLIVAREMGFAASEGLALDLCAAPSWSAVRDMLAFGRVEAAHMLSPVPVAMALGLGGVQTPLSAVSVLSVNGTVVGVGADLAARMRAAGHGFGLNDARGAADALKGAAGGPVVFGVPFPFSMHVALLRYWVAGTGLADLPITIRTVPPPLMAQALADGEIDAFCVGEPWGSVAVESGAGALILPGSAIWASAPEKVLAVRTDWAEAEPDTLARLMRAVWHAGQWLSRPGARTAAAELLSRPAYLDTSPELIDRALSGHLTATAQGEQRVVPGFLRFAGGAAGFPWRSQARWIAERLAQDHGLDPATAMQTGARVFRTDLYRQTLGPLGADMPGASEKVEGAIREPLPVASAGGRVILEADGFFDGRIFDPTA